MDIARVRALALSFDGATEEPHFDFASFRVRGKIFATVPPGDAFLHVFVDDADRDAALALHDAFVEKLWWGKKVAGLRIVLDRADHEVVEALLAKAWARRAPKPRKVRSADR